MPVATSDGAVTWRGCLFCMTGKENQVASRIEILWPGAKAYSLSAIKRRSRKGVKSIETEVIMPSYVFFEVDEGFMPKPPFPDGVIRILKNTDMSWKLTGRDHRFARWVVAHKGVLKLSQAYKVGDRIVIHQGPLKDLEASILKIDRRNRNGLVQLEIGNKRVRSWLPFEIVEAKFEQFEI